MNLTFGYKLIINDSQTDFLNNLTYEITNAQTRNDVNAEFMKHFNRITILVLYTLMILCFLLNSISVISILCSKAYTPINILILNLAISDVLYSSCIPIFTRQFTGDSMSEFACRVSFFLDVTCMIVSNLFLFSRFKHDFSQLIRYTLYDNHILLLFYPIFYKIKFSY